MQSFLQLADMSAAFFFFSSLKASALIALVLLAQKILGRLLSSRGHYLLWLPVVISLLTPFGFKTGIPYSLPIAQQLVLPLANIVTPAQPGRESVRQLPSSQPVDGSEFVQAPALQPLVNDSSIQHASESGQISWLSLLSLGWLAGVLLLLGSVLIRHFRFSRLVRRAMPANAALQNLLAACCKESVCTSEVRLLLSPAIETPVVTGCFKPVLLLPVHIEQHLDNSQLRHVFLHELMHVKRKDIAGNWLLTLMQCLHWFNPLVWLALSRMRNDRELVCDAAALHYLGANSGAAYGHTLLQLSDPQAPVFSGAHGMGMVGAKSQLRRRISLLVQVSSPTRGQSVLTALLLLVFGGLAFSKPVVEARAGAVSAPAFTEATATTITQPTPVLVAAAPSQSIMATAPAPSPRVHVEKSKKAATANTGTSIPATYQNAARESEALAEQPMVTAVIAIADTNPLHITKAAAETAGKPGETWSGQAALDALTRSISEKKPAGLKLVSEWNTIAGGCVDIPGQHRKRIACQKVQMITSGHQLDDFRSQCAVLADEYNKLARDYSAKSGKTFVNQASIATSMLRNYQDLTEFCSIDTYKKAYPAFAKLFDSAIARAELAKTRLAFDSFMHIDENLSYAGNGNGNRYDFSPIENNGRNPADYGMTIPGAGNSGAVSPGAGGATGVPTL